MSLLAAEGIRTLAGSLPIVVREPENLDARADALYGAWLAGVVLGSVGMAVHHNISHVLPVADRILLLEHGRIARTLLRGEITEDELKEMIAKTPQRLKV